MAGITGLGSGNMAGTFAPCRCAIMATLTTAQHLCVIDKVHGGPGKEVMTGLALAAGIDVAGVLALGGGTIMTADTTG